MVYSGCLPVPSLLDGVMMALLELEKVLEVGLGKGAALRLMLSSHRVWAVHVTGKKAPFPPYSRMSCG